MNHASDTTTADNSGNFDPQQAAAPLDQTTQQARRKFAPSTPLLSVFRAVVVLGAFGGVWLSVHGALYHAGASKATVFGLYPATAPLLIVGLVAAFGGPVGPWLIMGIGLCAVLLGTAAFTVWQERRSVVGP